MAAHPGGQSRHETRYTGSSKNEFCNRLGDDWKALADALEIPAYGQRKFDHGDEGRAIWDWLERRGHLDKLPVALRGIKRGDLANALEEKVRQSFRAYFADRAKQWSNDRFVLDRRFVQLTLLSRRKENQGPPRKEDKEDKDPGWLPQKEIYRGLGEVLEATSDPALVLLGPPGSGKSTLLRHVELDLSQKALSYDDDRLAAAPLTFFVPLNQYRPQPRKKAKDWLAERWKDNFPELPALDALLHERRLLLLLDALNEIPQGNRDVVGAWRDFVAFLANERPGNRAVFSCRTQDYGTRLSSSDLTVPLVRIDRLTDEQVREFIEKYCSQQSGMLWDELQRNPRQLDLFRSPYYLKLLIDQVSPNGHIPRGRTSLFTGFVRRALEREVDKGNPCLTAGGLLSKGDHDRLARDDWRDCELPNEGPLFPRLSTLAYRMQRDARGNKESFQVRVARDWVLAVLGETVPVVTAFWAGFYQRTRRLFSTVRLDLQQAESLLKAAVDLLVVEEDERQKQVQFYHQLLQEYFAARQLALVPDPKLVQSPWHVDKVRPSLKATLAQIAEPDPLPHLKATLAQIAEPDPLPQMQSTGWEETILLAAAMVENPNAFLADLMKTNLPVAGRCAAQPDVKISGELKATLQRALIERCDNPKADLRARIAAGLALGELGNPRFERHQGPDSEYLLPPMVAIRGGTYTIGSDKGDPDERPVHTVKMAPFCIGKFPVTNAEWALFMEARGYDTERWWETEEAKAWRRGESTAEEQKQEQRRDRQGFQKDPGRIHELYRLGQFTSLQAQEWEEAIRMSDEEFEARLDKKYPPGRQTQPAYWNNEAYNNPEQPVFGICWYEACAYCAWLSAQTGQLFRLPSESEWEAAARGLLSRCYAYGDDFDPDRCNTFETHIRRSTPIGVFPGSETPEGLVDMSGNTWEWTSSLYKSYPHRADDGREAPITGDNQVVIRGGSWFNTQHCARASYRAWRHPYARGLLDSQGARVVSSSAIKI